MKTKLTLTIEQSVIDKTKKYARENGRSLSEIVESYLKALTTDALDDSDEITLRVKSLKGSFKLPKDIEYKKELTNRLTEKYL